MGNSLEPESPEVNPVAIEGTLDLTFHNCNKGTASFLILSPDVEYPEGEFEIRRLAGLYNSRCSGGLDDVEYDIEYCGEVHATLTVSEGEGAAHIRSPGAEGSIAYEEEAGQREFEVEIKGLPAASYSTSCRGMPSSNFGMKATMLFLKRCSREHRTAEFLASEQKGRQLSRPVFCTSPRVIP